jgi:hypothetical protein
MALAQTVRIENVRKFPMNVVILYGPIKHELVTNPTKQ